MGRARLLFFAAAARPGILEARVLVLVAVDAQQLPVRAVGRVVVVVAVDVVHGELAQPRGGEFARAAGADPGQELQRLLAVVRIARAAWHGKSGAEPHLGYAAS